MSSIATSYSPSAHLSVWQWSGLCCRRDKREQQRQTWTPTFPPNSSPSSFPSVSATPFTTTVPFVLDSRCISDQKSNSRVSVVATADLCIILFFPSPRDVAISYSWESCAGFDKGEEQPDTTKPFSCYPGFSVSDDKSLQLLLFTL